VGYHFCRGGSQNVPSPGHDNCRGWVSIGAGLQFIGAGKIKRITTEGTADAEGRNGKKNYYCEMRRELFRVPVNGRRFRANGHAPRTILPDRTALSIKNLGPPPVTPLTPWPRQDSSLPLHPAPATLILPPASNAGSLFSALPI